MSLIRKRLWEERRRFASIIPIKTWGKLPIPVGNDFRGSPWSLVCGSVSGWCAGVVNYASEIGGVVRGPMTSFRARGLFHDPPCSAFGPGVWFWMYGEVLQKWNYVGSPPLAEVVHRYVNHSPVEVMETTPGPVKCHFPGPVAIVKG